MSFFSQKTGGKFQKIPKILIFYAKSENMLEISKGLTVKAFICRNFQEFEFVLIVLLTIFKIIL